MAWSNWINVPDVSGVTAGAGDVLSGKVIVDKNGNALTGNIPVRSVYTCADNDDDFGFDAGGFFSRFPVGYYSYPGYGKEGYSHNRINAHVFGNASASNVLSGSSFTSQNGLKINGSIPNKSGTTVDASAVTSDADYTYLTVPANGYYSTSSKIRTANSNVKPKSMLNVECKSYIPSTSNSNNLPVVIPCENYNTIDIWVNVSRKVTVYNPSGTSIGEKSLAANEKYTIDVSSYAYISVTTTTNVNMWFMFTA